MCVDDLVCVGAEPLFMLDYIATGQGRPRPDRDRRGGGARGLPPGRLRADRWRDGRARRRHGAATSSTWPASPSGVVEDGTQLGPERVRAGDAVVGLRSPGLRSNGYTLARHVLLERAGLELGDPAWAGATTAWPTSCCARR